MQLPLPQLRGNRPTMAALAVFAVVGAGTYAASSLRGDVASISPAAGQMGYCCNVNARSCDGPFPTFNPAMCDVPGYSGLLFSYGQNDDAQRAEAFGACQVACGIPIPDDVECPIVDCALPMPDDGCHVVERVDEAGCALCPETVCHGDDGGPACTFGKRCPVPMLEPGCRLEEPEEESDCAACPRVVCDGENGEGGGGEVCAPPPCAVPLVPEGCRLDGESDERGCPLCPTVVCDAPSIRGGDEDACRLPERCPVPELAQGCWLEERFDERGCAECPAVACAEMDDDREFFGGPVCEMPSCAVPMLKPGCRLQNQSDWQGCPVCPTVVCEDDFSLEGDALLRLDPPQVVGDACDDVFPQLRFLSRSGRFVGFTANHAVDPATQFNVSTLWRIEPATGEVTAIPNAFEARLEADGTVRYLSYARGGDGSVVTEERTHALPPEEGYDPFLPDAGSIPLRDGRIHTIRRVTGASDDGRFALVIGLGPTYIRDRDFQYVARIDLGTGLALPLNAMLNWEGLPHNLNDSEVIDAFMSADGDVVASNNSAISGNHQASHLYAHTISSNVLERVCSR